MLPAGDAFYTGRMFPAEYHNRISSLHSTAVGTEACLLVTASAIATLESNKVVKYEPFATGWLQNNTDVLGRPVDVEVAADGALPDQ